jgi:hypothetical protein
MILLIGMLFIKEEETRGAFICQYSIHHFFAKRKAKKSAFFTPFGGRSQSRTSNSTEKDNTFLHESHREREERIKERERR